MIVSFQWLKDYVGLKITADELANRLMMAGLNHESTEAVGDDLAVDLEVTSNRPDCLGHIGIAREAAVVFGEKLTIPNPQPKESRTPVTELASVSIECPELCSRYTARVIRGVKIGPSPQWLVDRLATIGIAAINNVVDISNYVLMECGQPLHTFDYAKLAGKKIIVRRAKPGEEFLAIDHKTYKLDEETCVIADAEQAVALGGVMGGADTEVTDATTEILIEAAEFEPLSIRSTARKLKLHSDSSYRFERIVNSEGVDWASRRCCELILQIAGGELAEGVIDIGTKRPLHGPIVLRLSQLERVLGIKVPREEVRRILTALGNEELSADENSIQVQPPSWRRDLEREIDLVEEVARIHGYDKIPEDVGVRMAASHRRDEDRRDEALRRVMIAAGFDEAMTASVVSEEWAAAFSPWSDAAALVTSTPLMRGADRVRMSLIPSLLNARQINQSLGNETIELFEMAKVYLPQAKGLPVEWWMLSLTSGGKFDDVKGLVESLAAALNPGLELSAQPLDESRERSHGQLFDKSRERSHGQLFDKSRERSRGQLLDENAACALLLDGEVIGVVGEVSPVGLKQFGLRSKTTIAEIRLEALGKKAIFVPQYRPLSAYPAIDQDLNFIVAESVRWADLADAVRTAGGSVLENVAYRETYRNPHIDGPDKKRLLLAVKLRSSEGTLTGEEAEKIRGAIVSACEKEVGAKLLG